MGADEGFTLIELLVVLLIIGVLLAIAIPTYLSLTGQADSTSAQADLDIALTGVKTYYVSHNQTYVGLTPATFNAIDTGLSAVPGNRAEATLHVVSVEDVLPGLVILTDYAPGVRACYGIVDDTNAGVAILGQPASWGGTLFFANPQLTSLAQCEAQAYDTPTRPAGVRTSTNGFSGL